MKANFWREFIFRVMEMLEDYALADSRRFLRMLNIVSESQALKWGCLRAETTAQRAWRKVPAYRGFLVQNGLQSPDVPFEQFSIHLNGYEQITGYLPTWLFTFIGEIKCFDNLLFV